MYPEFFVAIAICGLFLTYANGANDNFKGVATLYGSGVLSYRTALVSATVTTWIGSLAALVLAEELIRSFSGKGLVDIQFLTQGPFPVAVAGGAALTVLLATRLGLPISTTHALVGALVGAGLSVDSLNAARLATAFALPLALSPLLAASLAGVLYAGSRRLRQRWPLQADDCLCLEPAVISAKSIGAARVSTATATGRPGPIDQSTDQPIDRSISQSINRTISLGAPALRLGNALTCRMGALSLPGVSTLDGMGILHCLSGLMVSFARGLNDTPKIAGVLLIGTSLSITAQQGTIVAIASVMAIGGLLSSRRVARVMSQEITQLDEARGLTANLVTSFLVLVASKFGVPVSTTHVSCGALFGIGVSSGGGHLRTILTILASWLITLPVAAVLAAVIHFLFRALA